MAKPKVDTLYMNYGFRLNPQDREKLARLAAQSNRTISETLRTLVRLAEPVETVPFRFAPEAKA